MNYTAGSGNERICGNENGNVIQGKDGDDSLFGKAGGDKLYGGKGRDKLYGEGGDDILVGGDDNDLLDGGADSDTADYGREQSGNADDGVTDANAGATGVMVDLAGGTAVDTYGHDDTLKEVENVVGTSLADEIKGDSGPNVIDGNGASDGDDELDGREGEDTIVVSGDFNLLTSQDATIDPDIKGFENIQGKGNTVLTLTGDDKSNKITGIDATDGTTGDMLNGGAGNDTLMGLKGNDTLNGQAGNDKLYGGIGDDVLDGGLGVDNPLSGGDGNDCFLIVIPEGFVAATTVEDSVSPDPANANRKAIIRGTKDTISDYEDGDQIAIGGGAAGSAPIVYGTDTSKDASIAVKSVIIRRGSISIVTQSYRAASDNNTPNDRTDDIKGISQDTEILVTVPGLTETRFNSVEIGAACS